MPPSSTPSFVCSSCSRALRLATTESRAAAFSTSALRFAESLPLRSDEPRWKQTPPRMRMPHRIRPLPKQPIWKVNDKAEPVDAALDKFIGNAAGQDVKGRETLDEEVKFQWQSLTHRSFDHGSRPYNDKLAYLGKRILDLQTSLALLRSPPPASFSDALDPHIFTHPALSTLNNLTPHTKGSTLSPKRLAQLATSYGLKSVVRWKPRQTDNMESSGEEVVLATAVYAVVGALALQKGGEVAARVARERVLKPLGLKD
ncbi:hypothetical protein B0A48_00520 [Cryoendolithus antarcticus]|uniref:RNase III domain-containing protein n=1 Tax=Cryoendolithus antarcticus TaxID=1507870 RepID=A0A1V8TUW1_9PEZI|nr:hypothetical protein B0A48_00520 [Cryoendolithus antarcticus]